MKRPHTHPYHLPHEEIASFIDGTVGEIDKARIRVHLQNCTDCLESYRYAVRYGGAQEGMPADDTPSAEALSAAKAIAERNQRQRLPVGRPRRRRLPRLNPVGRMVFSTAAVAVFVVAVFWLRPGPAGDAFDPFSEGLAPVTRAMISASERNPLVLPGVENDLGERPATLRSGPAPITLRLDNSLSVLAVAYNDESVSSDEAQWLIGGYLATGQIENARVYIANARARYAEDTDLLVLEGILAYNDNDLEVARGIFETALRRDSENVVAAFNLAVVASEMGDARAGSLFERVMKLAPGSSLAGRAEAYLSETQ
jgi:hypothetical protein